jgi:hypothetical protein
MKYPLKTLLVTAALAAAVMPVKADAVTKNESDGCRIIIEAVSDKPVSDCAKLRASVKQSSDDTKNVQDCALTGSMLYSFNHSSPKDFADGLTAAVEGRPSNVNLAPPLLVRQSITRGCIMLIKDWPESDADRVVKKIDWSR